MPIIVKDGKILVDDGKIAASDNCCCGDDPCCDLEEGDSVTIDIGQVTCFFDERGCTGNISGDGSRTRRWTGTLSNFSSTATSVTFSGTLNFTDHIGVAGNPCGSLDFEIQNTNQNFDATWDCDAQVWSLKRTSVSEDLVAVEGVTHNCQGATGSAQRCFEDVYPDGNPTLSGQDEDTVSLSVTKGGGGMP